MRKLLLALVLLLIIGLSGCGYSNMDGQTAKPYSSTYIDKTYYTQEEVDELLANHLMKIERNSDEMESLQEWCEDTWIDVPDELLGTDGYYAHYDCIDMLEWYSDNWEEIYELSEYFYGDEFKDEMERLVINRLDELEQEFFEYQVLKFEWADYNAVYTMHQGEYITVHFYDNSFHTNVYILRAEVDEISEELLWMLTYNETQLMVDVDSFDGDLLDLVDELIVETIEENYTYEYFYIHYGTGE